MRGTFFKRQCSKKTMVKITFKLDKVELETSKLCYSCSFMNTLKIRYDLKRLPFKSFEVPPPSTSIFEEILKLADALKFTSFGHINMPRNSVIYCVGRKLRWRDGTLFTTCRYRPRPAPHVGHIGLIIHNFNVIW